jgi:hypothetical protein
VSWYCLGFASFLYLVRPPSRPEEDVETGGRETKLFGVESGNRFEGQVVGRQFKVRRHALAFALANYTAAAIPVPVVEYGDAKPC